MKPTFKDLRGELAIARSAELGLSAPLSSGLAHTAVGGQELPRGRAAQHRPRPRPKRPSLPFALSPSGKGRDVPLKLTVRILNLQVRLGAAD